MQALSYLIFFIGLAFLCITIYQKLFKRILIKSSGWIALVLIIISGCFDPEIYKTKTNTQNQITPKEAHPIGAYNTIEKQEKFNVMNLLIKNKQSIAKILGEPISKTAIGKEGPTIFEDYKYIGNIHVGYKNNTSYVIDIIFPKKYNNYPEVLREVGLPDNIAPTNIFEGLQIPNAPCWIEWEFSINGIKLVKIWGETNRGTMKFNSIHINIMDSMPPYKTYKPFE